MRPFESAGTACEVLAWQKMAGLRPGPLHIKAMHGKRVPGGIPRLLAVLGSGVDSCVAKDDCVASEHGVDQFFGEFLGCPVQ